MKSGTARHRSNGLGDRAGLGSRMLRPHRARGAAVRERSRPR